MLENNLNRRIMLVVPGSYAARSMSRNSSTGKSRVFLSYARKDGEEFATGLRKRLQREEREISLWQDRAELEGGVGWWKQIEEALDEVKFLVIVMTPAAMQSVMTRKEWRYARQHGFNVYPVKGCPDSELDYASLPNWMRKAHFFDLAREWETFVNYLKSDRQPARVPFMAPDFPEAFVQRPREFEQLIGKLVQEKRETPIAITTALQGAGGYGKTTLAVALCHDDRVIGTPDGRYVVSGSYDNTLRLWDLTIGRITRTLLDHTDSITVVAVTPDGRQVISGSYDKTLRVWDLATGETKTRLQGHTSWISAVAFTHDGRHVVSGSNDKTALVVAISPSECARPGSAVGAIKIGIDTGSPKTVVPMSLTLTSTSMCGSNASRWYAAWFSRNVISSLAPLA
jgi:WD40 repeat protein